MLGIIRLLGFELLSGFRVSRFFLVYKAMGL